MSDSFLSQEEVDALLEGVTGERQKSDLEEVEEGAVRNYDISSQGVSSAGVCPPWKS